MSAASNPLPANLIPEIRECGFYPRFVCATLQAAVGVREVQGYLVHHEATFVGANILRHMNVMVLTDKHLVICHADEGDPGSSGDAMATAEIVALRSISSVAITQSVRDPEGSDGPVIVEAWLAIAWGAASRIDLGPAVCEDPSCDADHGYTGTISPDDISIRISRDGDGATNASRLVEFGSLLQSVVG